MSSPEEQVPSEYRYVERDEFLQRAQAAGLEREQAMALSILAAEFEAAAQQLDNNDSGNHDPRNPRRLNKADMTIRLIERAWRDVQKRKGAQ